MTPILEQILASVRQRLDRRRGQTLVRDLVARAADQPPPRSLQAALRRPGKSTNRAEALRVLGELKSASPSAGSIVEDLDPSAAAQALADAGCRALSVLTEPDFFHGSLANLEAARQVVDVPLLRKDFMIEAYQIAEARAYGADAVLLLASVLEDDGLVALRDRAGEMGMEVLAEAHGEAELERLLALDLPIVGVNARDLRTFEVDLPGALQLCQRIPEDRVVVAESGVRTREDAQRVAAAGVDATLVGEGLMRGGDPAHRYQELFGG